MLYKNIFCSLRLTGHVMEAPFCIESLDHGYLRECYKCIYEGAGSYERYDRNPDFYFREHEVICTEDLLLDYILDTALI